MCNLNKCKCEGKCKEHNIFKSEEVVNLVEFISGKHSCKHKCHGCGGCHKNGSEATSVSVISEDMIK